MIRPVARWVKKLLSESLPAPTTAPMTVTTAPSPAPSVSRPRAVELLSPAAVDCTTGSAAEVVADVDDGGADDDHEQGREDAEHHRHHHLDRCLHGPLLGELTALDAHLVGLRSKDPPDRHAEGVGLEDRHDERAQLGHVGALL